MKIIAEFINRVPYYYKYELPTGEIYSLDMVRYNFEFINREEYIKKFQDLMNRYNMHRDCMIAFNIDKKSTGYKYMYNVKFFRDFLECSFCIGLQLNCKADNRYKGFIEFNPNKCLQLSEFEFFLESFMNLLLCMRLVRYDLAIDIPINRNLVRLEKLRNSNYKIVSNNSKDGFILNRSVTEYSGTRNKNRFTKLYDKTKESKLDYLLTRLEITLDRDELNFSLLPKVLMYDNNSSPDVSINNLKENDLVLIDLLRNCNELEFNFYFKRLSYHLRKKIEPYLRDKALVYDIDTILKVRNDALSYEL